MYVIQVRRLCFKELFWLDGPFIKYNHSYSLLKRHSKLYNLVKNCFHKKCYRENIFFFCCFYMYSLLPIFSMQLVSEKTVLCLKLLLEIARDNC